MTYLQAALFDPRNDWKPPKISELPCWKNAKRVAVDTETCDPLIRELGPGVRRGGFIAGISFRIEDDKQGYYLPIAHQGGDNLPADQVWAYMKEQAKHFTGELVGMNLPYDMDYLAEAGVVFRNARAFLDISVAAPLINEMERGYSMQMIAKRLGLEGKKEEGLRRAAKLWGLDPKAEMWRLPARHVAEYAIGDVDLPLAVLRRQELEIERQELWPIWQLETAVLPVVVKMRRRGVRIDEDRLARVESWAEEQEAQFLKRVQHKTGVPLELGDVWKAEQIAKAMKAIGVKLPLTSEGKPATGAEVLNGFSDGDDVPFWLLRARKFNKLRTTFAASIKSHICRGRIHPTFRQIRGSQDGRDDENGAAYGRFSCVDPNLQQQYNADREPEISGRWREIFLPEEGALWAANDYSAQEPRMTVHYAALSQCRGGKAMAERWCENPDMDLHNAMAETIAKSNVIPWACKKCGGSGCAGCNGSGYNRKDTKAVFLGMCYGMGGGKLCRSLGLPTVKASFEKNGKTIVYDAAGEEGQKVLDGFDRVVPFVRELAKRVAAKAGRTGFIRTILGRRCRFPKGRNGYDWTHKALNRLIQGSAADQTKMAMVNADRAGHYLQLAIHDEIDLSVADRAEAEKVAEFMRDAVPLLVPSKVDIEIGPSWGEAK